jgi:NhaP-type Na+/H+ or K+/H+ antiporter
VLEEEHGVTEWITFIARQLGGGVLIGIVLGGLGAVVLGRASRTGWADGRYVQVATFLLPIIALTAAESLDSNGFIGAFVAGLTFGAFSEMGQGDHFAEFTEDAAQLFGIVAFFIFGNLFVGDAIGSFDAEVYLCSLLALTIVRIVPVAIALTGTSMRWPSRLFVGWFGPRGLASIVFGILLLEQLEGLEETTDLILGVITVTVTASVLLHGASAAWGARVYGRWAQTHAHAPEEHESMFMVDQHMPLPRPRWSRSERT